MHLIHDLRNLLTVASVSVEHIHFTTGSERRPDPYLEVVTQCLESMFELVDEKLSTGDVPPPEHSVDLGQVIADRIDILRAAAGCTVTVKVEPPAAECAVRARAIDLERVVLNLVLNAAEAMPEGGVVTIETAIVPSASEPERHPPAPESVRLTVSDTGSGMPPEWEQRLLERLALSPQGGRGLGLASVNLVVLRLGGRFRMDSEEGVGTRVHIDLPRAKPWLPH